MRISTTAIESFRLFMQPDQDWMAEADLVATIKGEFTPTPAVLLGLAFGRLLEAPDRYRVPHGFVCDGYTFEEATMREPLAQMDYRHGVFEAKAVKAYGSVDVVAKVDQIVGAHIHEHKTTASSFTAEKYLESCQWRFYLDVFEAALVTYHVFQLDDHGNGIVEVKEAHTLNVFPYPALHEDCTALVTAFTSYVTAKGLDGFLRAKQEAAA